MLAKSASGRRRQRWERSSWIRARSTVSSASCRRRSAKSLHRGAALDQQTWAWTLELIELKHAERWQGAHVVGPKQVHQRVRQLGQLIVELLPQSTREEGEALQQSLDIGVSSTLPQKRRQGRVALSEPLAEPAKCCELALVMVIE